MPKFCDREREQKQLLAILEHEPSLVYFVHGPADPGKTALLTKVLKDLPEEMTPFYVNLRGRDISSAGDFKRRCCPGQSQKIPTMRKSFF